jgi:hypothetical protein
VTAGDCLSSGRQDLWPNGDRHPGSLHTIIILRYTASGGRRCRPGHLTSLQPIPVALSTPFVARITSRRDDRAHHVGCLALKGLGDMEVAGQGHRHRRVAEHLGSNLRGHPAPPWVTSTEASKASLCPPPGAGGI